MPGEKPGLDQGPAGGGLAAGRLKQGWVLRVEPARKRSPRVLRSPRQSPSPAGRPCGWQEGGGWIVRQLEALKIQTGQWNVSQPQDR